jgi:hypothetical protein
VLDVDIKGFFDNISQDILMRLGTNHTQEKLVDVHRTLVESRGGAGRGELTGKDAWEVVSAL